MGELGGDYAARPDWKSREKLKNIRETIFPVPS
jgi:hypothetical protein